MSGSYGVPAAGVAGLVRIAAAAGVAGILPQWFAVQTRYRFEKRVVAQLNHKSCEVYLPLLTENHTWSDRQKVVTIPLFPGYAFVHIDQSHDARQAVLQTAGLIGFVSFGGMVAAVPPKQIEDLQLLLQEKGSLFAARVCAYGTAGANPGWLPARIGRRAAAARKRKAGDLD